MIRAHDITMEGASAREAVRAGGALLARWRDHLPLLSV